MNMNIAKITVSGQITLPLAIRRKLALKDDDKVVFAEKDNNIILLNSNRLAFENFQLGMAGAAEESGFKNEQDIVDCIRQIRRDMWEEQNESNA